MEKERKKRKFIYDLQSKKEREIVSCKELAHIVIESEKSPDLAVIKLETQEPQPQPLSEDSRTLIFQLKESQQREGMLFCLAKYLDIP